MKEDKKNSGWNMRDRRKTAGQQWPTVKENALHRRRFSIDVTEMFKDLSLPFHTAWSNIPFEAFFIPHGKDIMPLIDHSEL